MYVPAKRPWAHQQEASRLLQGRKAFALFMAMRTGKTKVVIDDFGCLEIDGEAENLFVIAPGGVYKTWETEIREHASDDLFSRMRIHVWQSSREGSKTGKRKLEHFFSLPGVKVLLMNVEALSSVQLARQVATQFMMLGSVYLAVDESTIIKSPTAKRTRFVTEKLAPLAAFRRILSGLPTPRSPLDAFSQFEFLERGSLGHATFSTFKARYAIEEKICTLPNEVLRAKLERRIGSAMNVNGVGIVRVADLNRSTVMRELDKRGVWYQAIPRITGYRNEEELRDRISKLSYRVTLDQCYDVPPKMYAMREVSLTREQERIYNDIKEKATAELESMDHVTAVHVITRILRCHQVLCGHVRDENDKLHVIPDKRAEAVLEILEEHEGKAVIWCAYDYNINQISEALKAEYGENSVARFWGGNANVREAEEKRFQEGACRFMIATAGAGGRGRRWAMADLAIYHSNTNNLEHRNQSEERTQHMGKMEKVLNVDLVAPNTVDFKIIQALRGKIDMAAQITGDNYKEWLI